MLQADSWWNPPSKKLDVIAVAAGTLAVILWTQANNAMDGISNLMAESTAPAAKAVVLSVTADSAAPSADTAMLPNVDAMLNLMAESKTPIERCFH